MRRFDSDPRLQQNSKISPLIGTDLRELVLMDRFAHYLFDLNIIVLEETEPISLHSVTD
jgi:hypothetical protein